MACVICPWDIASHLHSVSNTPVCQDAWLETNYIPMSPEHELVPVHGMRDMSLGHIDTFTFCIKTPVYHGSWMETENISMSPGHELAPVHGMRDMFLEQNDTFTFCIKLPSMSWCLEGDWFYFYGPGTWISSSSWHAWYIPGTYRHIYILYQNPTYVVAPGWRMIIFPCPRDMN